MTKQYKHILVPLDTSELAELALEDAFSIAQLSKADITLLHVTPPIEHVIEAETDHPIYIDQQWESQKMLAFSYLKDICKRMKCPDVKVQVAVEIGPPAENIIDYASHHPVDLIVMATHGRTGLQRWVYGSVADKVLRGADVPVLLIRAYPQRQAA